MLVLVDDLPDKSPEWPPTVGSWIMIQRPGVKSVFAGKVMYIVSEDTCVVLLINNLAFTDERLKDIDNGKFKTPGFFVVKEEDRWQYINSGKLEKLTVNGQKLPELFDKLYKNATLYVQSKSSSYNPFIHDAKLCGIYSKDSLLINKTRLDSALTSKDKRGKVGNKKPVDQEVRGRLVKYITQYHQPIAEVPCDNYGFRFKTIAQEESAAEKIIAALIKTLTCIRFKDKQIPLTSDLHYHYDAGYIEITRDGIPSHDTVTPELIKLDKLKWQYGIPIDYQSLSYMLMGNKAGTEEEAMNLLSHDHFIVLQPTNRYQLWCCRQLILAWYGYEALTNSITKIKVLVNQWRARPDIPENRKRGISPSIIVMMRYGEDHFRNVMTTLHDIFFPHESIGWACSIPAYFSRVNKLVWYSDGSVDIKLHYSEKLAKN